MNEKKLAAIKSAYGSAWEKVNDYCDPDGFIERQVISYGITNNMEPEKYGFKLSEIRRISHSPDGYYKWRPYSLEGVETNNGWIPVEDFDSKYATHQCHVWGCDGYMGIYFGVSITRPHANPSFKYWKPVEEPNPPIY